MARLFGVSQPKVSRIVAQHRTASPQASSAATR
jgi:DNA-binding transcriptional regulator YdaS (Cro superfamily)